MDVGRTTKEMNDRTRVVVDFTSWLDPGEGMTLSAGPMVGVGGGNWDTTAPSTSIPDVTPLTVFSTTALDANTKLQFLLDSGTPGLSYIVMFAVAGSASGRVQTVELHITISPRELDPSQPAIPSGPYPTSSNGLAPGTFWNNGGVLCLTLSSHAAYPTSPLGLWPGLVWSNAGVVCVMSGLTSLYPTSPDGLATDSLWDNGGVLCVV